jgi:hypothetical protein
MTGRMGPGWTWRGFDKHHHQLFSRYSGVGWCLSNFSNAIPNITVYKIDPPPNIIMISRRVVRIHTLTILFCTTTISLVSLLSLHVLVSYLTTMLTISIIFPYHRGSSSICFLATVNITESMHPIIAG